MAKKIFIIGQIGNSYNADGSIAVKGVTVVDVASQLALATEGEEVVAVINSPGGSVSVGDQIAQLLSGAKNLKTLASEQCASIATKIHTCVPVENRLIEEGCDYMIHAPLFVNISGNATELEFAADQLKPIEADLVDHYAKATGLSKNVIKPLMSAESHLTPQECVSLGFASAVVPKMTLEAVAFADVENVTNKQVNMNKVSDFQTKLAALASVFKIGKQPEAVDGVDPVENPREAVAMTLESDKGVIVTPFSDIMVGDPVTLEDGTNAPDDSYTLPDGTVIVVSGGMVSEINLAEGGDMTAILVAKDEEIASLKAEIEAFKTTEALASQVIEKLEAKASRSTYVPKAVAGAHFKPIAAGAAQTTGRISKEEMAARRQAYNTAK